MVGTRSAPRDPGARRAPWSILTRSYGSECARLRLFEDGLLTINASNALVAEDIAVKQAGGRAAPGEARDKAVVIAAWAARRSSAKMSIHTSMPVLALLAVETESLQCVAGRDSSMAFEFQSSTVLRSNSNAAKKDVHHVRVRAGPKLDLELQLVALGGRPRTRRRACRHRGLPPTYDPGGPAGTLPCWTESRAFWRGVWRGMRLRQFNLDVVGQAGAADSIERHSRQDGRP